MNRNEARAIVRAFNKLTGFEEQMDFLKDHNKVIQLNLDNDYQYVGFIDPALDEDLLKNFDREILFNDIVGVDYFGCTHGVMALFKFIGIQAKEL